MRTDPTHTPAGSATDAARKAGPVSPVRTGAHPDAASGRASPPTRGRYVQLVMVLGALIALGPLSIDMYLPAFPAISADLGASDAATQLTLTGMLGGLAVGQLVIGPLSDVLGRRRPLLVGLGVHATASLLCALAPSVAVLASVRVLQGFSGAAISVVALATVRDLFSGVAVARTMSRLMLVIGLAPILAPSLGGAILTWTSWRGIFGVLAAAAAVLVAVAALGLRETLPVQRRRAATVRATLATYRSLLGDGTFVALTLVQGLMMSAMFAYVSGASFVLQGGFGLDAQTFGLVFGLNAAGLTVTAQLNPVMLRHWRVADVLSGAMLVAIASSFTLVVAGVTGFGGLVLVLAPLAVLVASVGLALPNTPALALTRHGEAAGTAAAMLGCVQFGVGAGVAPLVGVLGTATAAPMGAVMLTVTGSAAVLMFRVVRRDETAMSVR